MNPSIKIQIDELILHGFHPGDRRRITESFEKELGRLFKEGDLTGDSRSLNLDTLNARAIDVQTSKGPETTGEGIARAVFNTVASGSERGDSN